MTSQSSTTDIKRAGFLPLFRFTLKQYWTTILLFTIIFFFVLPVPVLMTISNRTIHNANDLIRLKDDFATDWVEVIRYFAIIISASFGIVVSCARFGYLKNKVSIDFYHSLPVKRSQLFLTQLSVGALTLAIPYVFNILFTLIVLMSNGLISELLIGNILIMSWEVFVYTLFTFSISTLVGMISGLTAVQLTLTLVAIFIVPAVYLASVAFVSIFSENMWLNFYTLPHIFEKLSPPLRLVINSDYLNLLESSLLILFSAAMLIGAYAVYMKRKSERAGTPVVFAPLGEIIKYVLVYLGTLCGGLLFYAMMDDIFWTVFGMVCGAVLVFMLANTILNKTARAMFKGWKGLCVFGAVSAIAFIMLLTNAFGINTRIPSPKFTSRVSVTLGSGFDGLEFKDEKVIEAISKIYKNRDQEYIYDKHGVTHSYETLRMQVVFYPDFGLPVAKETRIYNKSDFIEEFRTILDSEEFKAQYISAFDRIAEFDSGYMHISLPNYTFDEKTGKAVEYNSNNKAWHFDDFSMTEPEAMKFALSTLEEENKAVCFDFFQQQAFGAINAYDSSVYYDENIRLPFFTSMDKLANRYVSLGRLSCTPKEYNEKLAEAIEKITVYDSETGESWTITNKSRILEILNSATSATDSAVSPYTFVDTRYVADYSLEVTGSDDVYYYDDVGSYDVVHTEKGEAYTYENYYQLVFLLGKTPGFIIEHFE